jgi:ABC-type antimicrobial peptide transport system permease subunit
VPISVARRGGFSRWSGAEAQLFGLSPHDASIILWSTAAIIAVTIIAGLQPARRAAKVDPMVALRCE